MNDSSIARRLSRRLSTGIVTATVVASLAIASDQPLPFTEDFVDQAHKDQALTTADWGVSTLGTLQLGATLTLWT